MRLNKPTSIFAAGCCAFALAVSLQGCGNSSQSQTSQEQQSQTSAQSAEQSAASTASVASVASTASSSGAKQMLGTKSETSLEVATKNETGSVLDEVSVMKSEDADYGENLLAAGSTIKKGEEAVLYVDSASEKCSVRVHAQDTGEYLEFSNVPTANLKSMSLVVADGEYYVDYTTADGTKSSTKTSADEAAVAGAAVATQTTGDTENYSDIAAEDSTDAGTVEDYDYVDDSADAANDAQDYSADVAEPVVETTAVEEVAVPEQSADACQGDVVLRD